MGRAKARPAPCILYIAGLPGTTSPARASREQAPLRSRQAPGQPHTSDQAIARWDSLTGRPLGQPYSRYQAPDASSHAPGTHPARPVPQAGPVLSLAGQGACAPRHDSAVAHPGWLAGPSSRHACWRAQVRLARPAQAR